MKKITLPIAIVLAMAATISAQPPMTFEGCGELNEVSPGCLLFFAEDGTGPYVLDRYDSFVAGDSVHVIGVIDTNCSDCSAICLHNISISVCSDCCVGMRGDLNQDGSVDISDLMCLIAYAFQQGDQCFTELCIEMLDLNGDGQLDIADFTYLVEYMFHGGPAPVMCP